MAVYISRSYRPTKSKRIVLKAISSRRSFRFKKSWVITRTVSRRLRNTQIQASSLYLYSKGKSLLRLSNQVAWVYPRTSALEIGNISVSASSERIGIFQLNTLAGLIFSRFGNKLYRNSEIYNCLSFQEGLLIRALELPKAYNCRKFQSGALKLLSSSRAYSSRVFQGSVTRSLFFLGNGSCGILQDKDYIILDKLGLIELGLIAKEDNSVGEIIAVLLLLWQGETPSAQINITFYRYFVVRDVQSFAIQSFLISLMPRLSIDAFPSPFSF